MRLVAIAACLATASIASASPSQDLDLGRHAFRTHDFASACPLLNSLVHPRELLAQPDELVETYVMLGACLVETGRPDDARLEFTHALQLQPDRSLTSIYSADSIKVFEETRAKLAAADKAAADAKKLKDLADQVEAFKRSTQFFEIHPYSRNFVPFGAGQFQNRTPVKGIVFAATESVALATSVGTWFYLINTYGLNAHVSREQGISVLRLQRVEVGSGIAFIALYAVGVIDSLVHYRPRAKVEADESLLPAELRKLRKPAPTKPTSTSSFHVTPMLSPDSVGIGIGWEN